MANILRVPIARQFRDNYSVRDNVMSCQYYYRLIFMAILVRKSGSWLASAEQLF